MYKLLEINEEEKIIINSEISGSVQIKKIYTKDGNIRKTINFSISEDILFKASQIGNTNKEYLEFEFTIEDPLYFILNRLLANENFITIDDDDTKETKRRYLEIKKQDDKIKIIFHNKKENKNYDDFRVCIKNVVLDCRSKIKNFNIKLRIEKFFTEAEELLYEESHQITLDEYFEILRLKKLVKGKNPFLTPHKIKIKNPGENCSNCEYAISIELADAIIQENSEYREMDYYEALEKIPVCEFGIDINTLMENNYWCEFYLPDESRKEYMKKTNLF